MKMRWHMGQRILALLVCLLWTTGSLFALAEAPAELEKSESVAEQTPAESEKSESVAEQTPAEAQKSEPAAEQEQPTPEAKQETPVDKQVAAEDEGEKAPSIKTLKRGYIRVQKDATLYKKKTGKTTLGAFTEDSVVYVKSRYNAKKDKNDRFQVAFDTAANREKGGKLRTGYIKVSAASVMTQKETDEYLLTLYPDEEKDSDAYKDGLKQMRFIDKKKTLPAPLAAYLKKGEIAEPEGTVEPEATQEPETTAQTETVAETPVEPETPDLSAAPEEKAEATGDANAENDETKQEAPEETPEETPEPTPEETPEPTPEETPAPTPEETPEPTEEEIPTETRDETPLESIGDAAHETIPVDPETETLPEDMLLAKETTGFVRILADKSYVSVGDAVVLSTDYIAPDPAVASVLYQWQYSDDGVQYADLVGETGATLALTVADGNIGGYYQIAVTITPVEGGVPETVPCLPFQLTRMPTVAVSIEPDVYTVGSMVTLRSALTPVPPDTVHYRWLYVAADTPEAWANPGVIKTTGDVALDNSACDFKITIATNGYYFRVEATVTPTSGAPITLLSEPVQLIASEGNAYAYTGAYFALDKAGAFPVLDANNSPIVTLEALLARIGTYVDYPSADIFVFSPYIVPVGATETWIAPKNVNIVRSTYKSGLLHNDIVQVLGALTIGETGATANVTINGNKGTEAEGSAVYVATGATLTIYDGAIIGNNTTTGSGGGVYNDGTFDMRGGLITANASRVLIQDPEITAKRVGFGVTGQGGGVFNAAGATMTVTGGRITNNVADFGAGIYQDGTLTMGGTVQLGNSVTAQPVYLSDGTENGGAQVKNIVYLQRDFKVADQSAKLTLDVPTYEVGRDIAKRAGTMPKLTDLQMVNTRFGAYTGATTADVVLGKQFKLVVTVKYNGSAQKNATVQIGDETVYTDSKGRATFMLVKGTHSVYVKLSSSLTKTVAVSVTKDTKKTISLSTTSSSGSTTGGQTYYYDDEDDGDDDATTTPGVGAAFDENGLSSEEILDRRYLMAGANATNILRVVDEDGRATSYAMYPYVMDWDNPTDVWYAQYQSESFNALFFECIDDLDDGGSRALALNGGQLFDMYDAGIQTIAFVNRGGAQAFDVSELIDDEFASVIRHLRTGDIADVEQLWNIAAVDSESTLTRDAFADAVFQLEIAPIDAEDMALAAATDIAAFEASRRVVDTDAEAIYAEGELVLPQDWDEAIDAIDYRALLPGDRASNDASATKLTDAELIELASVYPATGGYRMRATLSVNGRTVDVTGLLVARQMVACEQLYQTALNGAGDSQQTVDATFADTAFSLYAHYSMYRLDASAIDLDRADYQPGAALTDLGAELANLPGVSEPFAQALAAHEQRVFTVLVEDDLSATVAMTRRTSAFPGIHYFTAYESGNGAVYAVASERNTQMQGDSSL